MYKIFDIVLIILYITTMKKQQLSYYEKRSILSMVVLIIVYVSMFYDAAMYYKSENIRSELLNFWGNQFLGLFLCLILVQITVLAIFNIVNKKITGEERPKIKDERDNVIELKAVHASYHILVLGVFVAMLTALRVKTYSPIFLIILGSFMLSGIIADVIRIVSYRKTS